MSDGSLFSMLMDRIKSMWLNDFFFVSNIKIVSLLCMNIFSKLSLMSVEFFFFNVVVNWYVRDILHQYSIYVVYPSI